MKRLMIILAVGFVATMMMNDFNSSRIERLPIPQFTAEEMQAICIEEGI